MKTLELWKIGESKNMVILMDRHMKEYEYNIRFHNNFEATYSYTKRKNMKRFHKG